MSNKKKIMIDGRNLGLEKGTGVATFISDREFTSKVSGTFNATGIQQKGSMDTRAVWLGQDCGTVKPRT